MKYRRFGRTDWLAQLIQQKLDPSLRIYIEYSTKCGTGGFPQGPYAQSQGVAMNLVGTNQSYKGWSWYVYRSVQVYQGFEAVFGKDSPRLVKVLSGQAGYTGLPPIPRRCARGTCRRSPTRR